MLEWAVASGGSLCLSVRPFVCHTRQLRLHGSKHRNAFCTVRRSDISSFLRPNFIVVSLGFHPKDCVKKRYRLSKAKIRRLRDTI